MLTLKACIFSTYEQNWFSVLATAWRMAFTTILYRIICRLGQHDIYISASLLNVLPSSSIHQLVQIYLNVHMFKFHVTFSVD